LQSLEPDVAAAAEALVDDDLAPGLLVVPRHALHVLADLRELVRLDALERTLRGAGLPEQHAGQEPVEHREHRGRQVGAQQHLHARQVAGLAVFLREHAHVEGAALRHGFEGEHQGLSGCGGRVGGSPSATSGSCWLA
jgi:hypothetical protein